MKPIYLGYLAILLWAWGGSLLPASATEAQRYYAYPAVEDRYGVIAPWYRGQNGQCDLRVRIAAETLKRYPWAVPPKVAAPAPEFVYNGTWQISADGAITVPPLNDWNNGDYGQRAAYVLSSLVDYYRYSGDASAIALISLQADEMLNDGQTSSDNPWPKFFISVPNKGKPYAQCDAHGMIQLDIVAEAGLALVRAYELTGNKKWLDAAAHWGDLLAAHRGHDANRSPWNRYANPEAVSWDDEQTGGVVYILTFLDELIRAGHRSPAILEARQAGIDYERDTLLPRWTDNDTWGRNYWDWADEVQAVNVTDFTARYFMEHPREFPNWRADTRNMLALFLNHTSVAPVSDGDVYSGAWAYPESSSCCGRSLWYSPLELAPVFAQYGVTAESEWGRELARRQILLATYDAHETGVVEDNIDGGQIVAGGWFKIAHPAVLKHVLSAMAWLPEDFGAAGENHIMRSQAVVNSVNYEQGKITYSTFDAPADCVDVLRLAFLPKNVTANGRRLSIRHDLSAKGWEAKELGQGDWLVSIRHDGARNVGVEGDDPGAAATGEILNFAGSINYSFAGNQVRVIGDVGPNGGLADVFLDGMKQSASIDCWNPDPRQNQVLFYRNGMSNQTHHIEVIERRAHDPVSQGNVVRLNAVQWSAADRPCRFGEGGGPTNTQRFIFGSASRNDWIDSAGHAWRPGAEFIVRSGNAADSVAESWWREPRRLAIGNTPDPELYRYGVHAHDFTVFVTVGPGVYHARLKFCETRNVPAANRLFNLQINGADKLKNFDIAATAGGINRAADVVFDDIQPAHGIVELHFSGGQNSEAILQALEVGPGPAGEGAKASRLTTNQK